jgi:hypothetical protein
MESKPVSNIQQLRFRILEKFADLENKKITVSEAKAFTGIAAVVVNSCKAEIVNNQLSKDASRSIDFMEAEYRNPKIKLID